MSFTINNYQIDHNSFVPYYAQIAQYLREQIKIGNLPPGSLLPSETELCNAFKVSRIVARQALQELEYEGLVYRQRGKGTFVAEPKVHEQLVQRLTGFHQDMVDQGHRVSNKVLRQEIISADGEIGRRLRLSPNDEVIAIERLRLVDEKAINFSVSYVPYHLCPDLLESDLTKSSLYAFLETCVGRRIARGQRTIEAILPSSSIAQLLEIDTKLPVFRITNICYLDDGTPIEYSIGYHRSDRTLFEVQLIRNSEQTLPAGYTLVR